MTRIRMVPFRIQLDAVVAEGRARLSVFVEDDAPSFDDSGWPTLAWQGEAADPHPMKFSRRWHALVSAGLDYTLTLPGGCTVEFRP